MLVHIAAWLLVLGALVFPAYAATAPAQLERVRLQLKWRHQFQFAGYYAAAEKGFFAEEGLSVELVEARPGMLPVNEVLEGRADFAVDSPGVLLRRAEGKPVVVLAAIFQHSPTVVITRKDSHLETPQSLAGKKVMFTLGTDPESQAMLANEGVTLKDFTLLPHSWSLDDLISGKVDAISAYVTDEPHVLEKLGVPVNIIYPIQYAVDFYGDCLVTSEAEVLRHPLRAEGFLRAVRKGWAYAFEHPDEIADVVLARYSQSKPKEDILLEAEAMRPLVIPDLVDIGHMNPDRWRHMVAVYEKLGMLSPGFNMTGFLYPEFKAEQEAAERKVALRSLAVLAGLLVLGGLWGSLMFAFNRKLKRAVQASTQELSDSRDFLRQILKAIPDPVFVKDAEHRFVLVNEATAALVGLAPGDMVGLGDEDFFPPEQVAEFWRCDDAVLRTGRENVNKENITGALGETRLISTKKSLCVDGSGNRYVVGVIRDITDYTRLQETMVQAEKMISLGNLAAGMAHEINNPLGIVLQSCQNLERRLFQCLDANLRNAGEVGLDFAAMSAYLERRGVLGSVRDIRQAGERAAIIVRNMLQFSRKSDAESEPCDLAEVADAMLELMGKDYDVRRNYDIKKVAIVREYADDRFPVCCSRNQIGQVVLNVLLNAVHAMCGGEHPTANPRLIVRLRPEGEAMRLEIADNGPGMDEAVRRRIFDPFFTTKPTGQGTGLGLFVSYNIVTATHNGSMSVESEPGKGATFIIVLPREQQDTLG